MRTVSAPFERHDQVTAAVEGLSDMGVESDEISIVPLRREPGSRLHGPVILGMATGGAGGIFVAAFTGSVFGEGWLAFMLLGAVVGGFVCGAVSLLKGAGTGETDANRPTESLQPGSVLVAARVHDDEAGEALAILRRCRTIDTDGRRGESANDGWDGFAAKDIWDEDIGSEDERSAAYEGRSRRVA